MATDNNEDCAAIKKISVFGPAHYAAYLETRGLTFNEPCEVDLHSKHFAGNGYIIARYLKTEKFDVKLLSVLSDDSISRLVREMLVRAGIELFPFVVSGHPTASSIEVSDNSNHIVLDDSAIYRMFNLEHLRQQYAELKSAKTIFLDTSFPQEVYVHLALVVWQHKPDIHIFISSVKTAKNIESLIPNAKTLFLSIKELNQLTGLYDSTQEGIKHSMQKLLDLGVKNIFAVDPKKEVHILSSHGYLRIDLQEIDKVLNIAGPEFAAAVVATMHQGTATKENLKQVVEIALSKMESKVSCETQKKQVEQNARDSKKASVPMPG